jgi:hypothetical protein
VLVGSYGFSWICFHIISAYKKICFCSEEPKGFCCVMWWTKSFKFLLIVGCFSTKCARTHLFLALPWFSDQYKCESYWKQYPFAELTEMSNFCYICKHGIQFLCHFLCILLLLSKYLLHNIWPETSSKCQFSNSITNVQTTDTIEKFIKLQLRNWYLDFKPDIGSN